MADSAHFEVRCTEEVRLQLREILLGTAHFPLQADCPKRFPQTGPTFERKSGRLIELESCCGPQPPVRMPANLLQGLTIES
jgi:hypothetical protein